MADYQIKNSSSGRAALFGKSVLLTLIMVVIGVFCYERQRVIHSIRQGIFFNFSRHTDQNQELQVVETTPGYSIPLEHFLINLSQGQGQKLFKVKMEFYVDSADIRDEINQRMLQVRDIVIILLASKDWHQIATNHGQELLKEEIRDTVNAFLTRGRIEKVLFTQFTKTYTDRV